LPDKRDEFQDLLDRAFPGFTIWRYNRYMTVQELIFELEMIADKNKKVVIYDYGLGSKLQSDIYSTSDHDDYLELEARF
jgi:hypothetical protein